MGMLGKVEEFRRKTVFYGVLKGEWDLHCVCDWVTLIDTLVGILMESIVFMEDMV